MKPSPKQLKETKEIYEKVVTHLIEEGYATDVESADSIISGMSEQWFDCLLYTSPSPRDLSTSRMPSSA